MADASVIEEILDPRHIPAWYAVEPFEFERSLDRRWVHHWTKENWTMTFYCVGIYLFLVAGLRRWIQHNERYELKGLLVVWNLGLAIFSIFASVRLIPEFVRMLSDSDGFHKSVCDLRYASLLKPSLYVTMSFQFVK